MVAIFVFSSASHCPKQFFHISVPNFVKNRTSVVNFCILECASEAHLSRVWFTIAGLTGITKYNTSSSLIKLWYTGSCYGVNGSLIMYCSEAVVRGCGGLERVKVSAFLGVFGMGRGCVIRRRNISLKTCWSHGLELTIFPVHLAFCEL